MKTMRPTAKALFALALAAYTIRANAAVHIWEKQEVTLTSARVFPNPYTDVTVWVDLTGPNFKKRVYGFWDGAQTFRVRVLATAPGTWTWRSGSNPPDQGLSGKTGSFAAIDWTEAEKLAEPATQRLPAAHGQPSRARTRRWHALLRHRRHLVCHGHQPLQMV